MAKKQGFKNKQKAIKNFGTAAASTSDPAAAGRALAKSAKARARSKALKKTSANKKGVNQK